MSRRRGAFAYALLSIAAADAFSAGYATGDCSGERERARATAQRIADEWPQRDSSDEISSYVQALGERLAGSERRGFRESVNFIVLRDRSPFAFAIGSGFFYVTEGALSFARSESELAAIMAHEMGHQMAGHFCDSGHRVFKDWWDGHAPRNVTHSQVGSLSQEIDATKEQEADAIAVSLLTSAALSPNAMLDVATRLPTYSHRSARLTPVDIQRINTLKVLMAEPSHRPRTISESASFAVIKRQLEQQDRP